MRIHARLKDDEPLHPQGLALAIWISNVLVGPGRGYVMRPQFQFGEQRKVMCLKWLINYGHIDTHMSMCVCQFRVASFYEDPSMDQENVAMSSGGHLVVIHAVDLSSP